MARIFRLLLLLVSLTGLSLWGGNAYAVSCTSVATGNWNTQTTWGAAGTGCAGAPGGIPGATDTVLVNNNLAVTVPAGTSLNAANLQLGQTGGGPGTGTGSLIFAAATSALDVTGSVTLGSSNRAGSIDMTNGGTLTAGSFAVNTLGTWIPGTGTVVMTATNTLPANVGFTTFNNLTVAAGTTTLGQNTTINDALTVTAGSLDTATFTMGVAGNFVVNGTVSGTGAITLSGNTTTIDGIGSVTNTTTLTINTGAKTIPATANLAIASPIAITGAVTVTNNGTITSTSAAGITGTVAGSTCVNAAGSTLNVSGPLLATGTLTATAAGNTVNYTGATQTVKATAYYHLGLSGSGAMIMTGVTAIGGNLNISGTATMTANAAFAVTGALNYSSTGATTLTAATSISIGSYNQTAGTLIDNGNTITVTGTGANTWAQTGGAFTPTGTVIFTGTAPQIGTANFNNLTINAGVGNTATLTGNVSLSGVLTLTSGLVSTGANVLDVGTSCVGVTGSSTSYVLGNFRLHYPTNNPGTTTCIFPIGDATAYTPVTVAMTNVSSTLANSTLTASTTTGDHPDTTAGTSGINSAKGVNRYWSLTPGAGLTFATYDTTFNFVAGDVDGSATTANFIIGRKNAGVWNYPAMGAANTLNTSATGMTLAGGFGAFAIGNALVPSITLLKTIMVFSDPVNGTTNPKLIPGSVAVYTIIASNSGGPADNNSTIITNPISANTLLHNSPVSFTQGTTSSTLTFNIATDLSYSNNGGSTWTATPSYDPTTGCDITSPSITNIRINPKGVFAGSVIPPSPSFQLTFGVCVK